VLHPSERRRQVRLRPSDYMSRWHCIGDTQSFAGIGPSREWEAASRELARGPATGTCRRSSPNATVNIMPATAWIGSELEGGETLINREGERLYDVWIHRDRQAAQIFLASSAVLGADPSDAELVAAMKDLIESGVAKKPHAAAELLADEARGKNTERASKVKRLERAYRAAQAQADHL